MKWTALNQEYLIKKYWSLKSINFWVINLWLLQILVNFYCIIWFVHPAPRGDSRHWVLSLGVSWGDGIMFVLAFEITYFCKQRKTKSLSLWKMVRKIRFAFIPVWVQVLISSNWFWINLILPNYNRKYILEIWLQVLIYRNQVYVTLKRIIRFCSILRFQLKIVKSAMNNRWDACNLDYPE